MRIRIADACAIAAAMLGCEVSELNSDLRNHIRFAEGLARGVNKELEEPNAIAGLITAWTMLHPLTAHFAVKK